MTEPTQAERIKIWEQGWRAGRRSAVSGLPTEKNPYGTTEQPSGPPEFPEFWYRLDETMETAMERWTMHMRDFKAAWDEWSRGLR